MSVTDSLASQLAGSVDVQALAQLATKAIEEGEEERALPLVQRAAEQTHDALLWQWRALLERALDEHEAALLSFETAARLDPTDVSVAHGHARTAMEAGLDACDLYERALSLAPRNGQLIVGMAAARVAEGDGARAISDLEATLQAAPAWLVGHERLAQIKATQGEAATATSSLEDAIRRFPTAQSLWETLLNVELRRGNYEVLQDIVDRATGAGVKSSEFAIYEGIHAAQFDTESFPEKLFGPASPHVDKALSRWRVRHLLRVRAVDEAVKTIDGLLQTDETAELWAYAATAWRLADDPRSTWLERDPAFVQAIELGRDLPPLPVLADNLRNLHVAKGEYLDQSVRGGTQTDGPLLSRIDPIIRQLRKAIVAAVSGYIAQLPPPDPNHPLLQKRRDRRIRFAGSWSVRLRNAGYHANHVHPLGWISSALYVSLPGQKPGEREDSGWLALGEPDAKLRLDLAAWRKVEPQPARLVLFPSWMWHGTIPFEQGERLTVAFDVAPPT